MIFLFFAHSNLDILFKGALTNKRHKNFDHLFDFALEGLEEFNYRKLRYNRQDIITVFTK